MTLADLPSLPEELKRAIDELRSAIKDDDVLLMDYHSEYLKSKLWQKIKRRILKRDNKTCLCCGGKGNIVHHRSYEREVLEGNADHWLATVCEGCHNLIHFDESGAKRSPEECDHEFLRGQRQRGFPLPKIDLRRLSQVKPAEWPRMTSVQRNLWAKKAHQLRCERMIAKGRKEYEQFLPKT